MSIKFKNILLSEYFVILCLPSHKHKLSEAVSGAYLLFLRTLQYKILNKNMAPQFLSYN